MKPIFEIQFGFFPIYWLMILIGCIVGMCMFNSSIKRGKMSKYVKSRVRSSMFWGALCGFIFSNLIHWVVMEDLADLPAFERFTHGGHSVYFGALGFLVVTALLLRLHKLQVNANLSLAIMPLIVSQMIWRAGCALRGCCYGIGEELYFPVRFCEILMLLALAIILRTIKNKDKRATIYLFVYSVLRFATEFLRGDYRGVLFGIDFLTPTQVVAIFVSLISGYCLFARPIIKRIGKEEQYNALLDKLCFWRRKDSACYTPLDQNYTETTRVKRPLRIVAIILVIAIIISTIFAAWNPFSWSLFNKFSTPVQDWLFAPRGHDAPIGDTNSTTIIDLSGHGKIDNAQEALVLVNTYDRFSKVTLSSAKSVSGNSRVYVFQQTINDKPVLGTECVLVTDHNGNAQYLVSDAANRTYAYNTATPMTRAASKLSGKDTYDGYKIIDSKEVYYVNDAKAVDAVINFYSKLGGDTSDFGVVIDKFTGNVLSFTDPDGKYLDMPERVCIILATANVKAALSSESKIKNLINTTPSGVGNNLKYQTLSRVLAKAYQKSGLSSKEFTAIIDNSRDVIREVTGVNSYVFCEVFVAETLSYLTSQGNTQKYAESVADKIESTFERNGLKKSKDQVATAITVREFKSTFRYKMDFVGDSDLLTVNGIEGQTTEISVETDAPLSLVISNEEGIFLTSYYVEKSMTISLAPQDGSVFTVQVLDKRHADATTDESSYTFMTKSIENENESQKVVAATIKELERAYNAANLSYFGFFITNEEKEPYKIIDIIGSKVGMVVSDACSRSCTGEGVDIAAESKAEMLDMLIGFYDMEPENTVGLYDIHEVIGKTKIELRVVDEKTIDGVTYAKVSLGIFIEGAYLYEGYSYMQFENIEGYKPSDDDLENMNNMTEQEQAQKMEWFLTQFQRDGYYITAFNTETIKAVFGDTLDNPSSRSDLTSLYAIWDTYELKHDEILRIKLHKIDSNQAIEDGHSIEQVDGFELFIDYKNLADLTQLNSNLQYQLRSINTDATVQEIFFFGLDCYTGGIWAATTSKVLDEADLGWIEYLVKGAKMDFDGMFEDIAGDSLQNSMKQDYKSQAKKVGEYIKVVDEWIENYEMQSEKP